MIDLSRFLAMASQCKNKGGSCNCVLSCKAEVELSHVQSQLRELLDTVNWKLKWLRHKPCTIRADWKRPDKPEGNYHLCVHDTGDGWWLHWYSETEDDDCADISGPDSWPFEEDTAWGDDWEALGIEVV